MAVTRAQADPTIVQSAVAAYTPAKVDYSGYVTGINAVAKMLVGMQKTAGNRVNQLNKAYDVLDFDALIYGGGQFEKAVNSVRNNSDFTYDQKLRILQGTKGGMNKMLELGETLKTLVNKNKFLLSDSIDPLQEQWIYSIINNTLQDVNNDGTVDDKEAKLEIFRVNPSTLKWEIRYLDGEYIDVEKVQTDFPQNDHGKDIYDEFIDLQNDLNLKKFKGESLEEKYNAAKKYKNLNFTSIEDVIKRNTNARKSAMFDYKYSINGEPGIHFYDYYLSGNVSMVGEENTAFAETYNRFVNQDQIWDKKKEKWVDFDDVGGDEVKEKMKKLIVQDALKYDGNITQDFIDFLELILDSEYENLRLP